MRVPPFGAPLQDTNSRSFVVRAYYRSRMFMGFCCICCEVLYLALYALSWRQYQAPVLHLPQPAQALGQGVLQRCRVSGRPGGGVQKVLGVLLRCVPAQFSVSVGNGNASASQPACPCGG